MACGELAIVMAAGKGTRMKSDLPKVLAKVRGRPMIEFVLDALDEAGVKEIVVVVGYRADDVRAALAHRPGLRFAVQTEQLGTGHAVMVCREHLESHTGAVLVVAGDSPLMQADSVRELLDAYREEPTACIVGTAHREDPAGLGRILRDERGEFVGIVEHKDATEDQRRITEVNMSYYVFDAADLLKALEKIRADNVQREYYLTDCPGVMFAEGKRVRALPALKPFESLGVNTVDDLAAVEEFLQERDR